ncbi:MAG: hypothetical protein HY812_02040 [Planctomycetes bacterium]|nr:hypothetical protein [Planctomycetota bacterium]
MDRACSRGRRSSFARRALIACGLLGAAGCVSELDPGQVVVLPPEAYRSERFIEAECELSADRVVIEAVRAYRKDFAPIIDEDYHSKEITPDRITLVNLDSRFPQNPVTLSFRNMRVFGRERIEVVFSDAPLLKGEAEPLLLLLVGKGVAHFRGDGVDLTADRVVIRNDEVKGFMADGRPVPQGLEGP